MTTRANRAASGDDSSARAWSRALQMTAPIARHPHRILPTVIAEHAARFGEAPAILSERDCLTYSGLAMRANQYSRWALAQGIGKGDCVGLFMSNSPEYMAIWLGITQIGGVVALLNTNLAGHALAHCINLVAAKHLIVAATLSHPICTALPELTVRPTVWIHGGSHESFCCLELKHYAEESLDDSERPLPAIEDRALFIYTSGTTGLPKAACISHGRVMQWSHWFAGMMNTQPTDRMYMCLPMYHSVGGVQAPGAVLARGGALVVAEKFSASRFWSQIVEWDCTLLQYIGELCRYLLQIEPSPHETAHRIRMACGNGLRADIWNDFKDRFRIPRILEFYGATEGNVSLFNAEGEPGALGRIPSYLAHRFPATLVKFDVDTAEPVRNQARFCIPCAPNEIGEALGPILNDPATMGTRFEGYTSREASEKKILRNVFQAGDAWFRTGDLMRKDERGFFYFVDRIGDTFRWKGENVATSEVAETLCAFPGIKEANVYGVAIPGADGRAGMAALVADPGLDLIGLRAHLNDRLPEYARPLFLRMRNSIDITTTFKYTKTDLVRQGYDPSATDDQILFNDPETAAFVILDKLLYDRIQAGQIFRPRSRHTDQLAETHA